jgi:uncharacterized membrane-anchored protein YitT (DUF2179 family)
MNMTQKKRNIFYSVSWNLVLLSIGSIVLSIGIKAIAIPNGFITGGFSGLSLLIYYVFGGLFSQHVQPAQDGHYYFRPV